MKNRYPVQNQYLLYVLLTCSQICYAFSQLATETHCRDETDPIKQTGGPDFVAESWIYVTDLDLYPLRVQWAPWWAVGGRAFEK